MSAEGDYDTTNLNALRQELRRLNETALANGLIAPREGRIEIPRRPRKRRAGAREAARPAQRNDTKAVSSPDAGKAAAQRLVALAGRIAGDKTPAVPDTPFTVAGVARLLAHLDAPRKLRSRAWLRFRRQMSRFLNRPVSSGIATVSGISIDRLKVVARHLREIEQNGWAHFREKRVLRRLKVPRPETTKLLPQATTQPEPAPTEGRSR